MSPKHPQQALPPEQRGLVWTVSFMHPHQYDHLANTARAHPDFEPAYLETRSEIDGHTITEAHIPRMILDAIAQTDGTTNDRWQDASAAMDDLNTSHWPCLLKTEIMLHARTGWAPADNSGQSASGWEDGQGARLFQQMPE